MSPFTKQPFSYLSILGGDIQFIKFGLKNPWKSTRFGKNIYNYYGHLLKRGQVLIEILIGMKFGGMKPAFFILLSRHHSYRSWMREKLLSAFLLQLISVGDTSGISTLLKAYFLMPTYLYFLVHLYTITPVLMYFLVILLMRQLKMDEWMWPDENI